jgi:hypothetical protein
MRPPRFRLRTLLVAVAALALALGVVRAAPALLPLAGLLIPALKFTVEAARRRGSRGEPPGEAWLIGTGLAALAAFGLILIAVALVAVGPSAALLSLSPVAD